MTGSHTGRDMRLPPAGCRAGSGRVAFAAARLARPGLAAFAAGCVIAGCAIAGCGTAKVPGPATVPGAAKTPAHATTAPAVSTAACTLAQLRVSIDLKAVGVAAGTSYLPLTFVNASSAPCILAGYPQVEPVSGQAGHRLGGTAAADRSRAARALRLSAGQAAHAWLVLEAAANLPPGQCHPVTAAGLLVTLPGQAGGSFVKFGVQACGRPQHGAPQLTVDPFQPGRPTRGTAP